MTTQMNNALQDHAPAQMVGGMRVRASNRRRSSIVAGIDDKHHDEELVEQENHVDEARHFAEQRQRAYQAARDAQLPRHPHTNHQPRIDPSFQPRDMNH